MDGYRIAGTPYFMAVGDMPECCSILAPVEGEIGEKLGFASEPFTCPNCGSSWEPPTDEMRQRLSDSEGAV